MLNELRVSIASAIHQHRQSAGDVLQKCFECEIEKFPENLAALTQGNADERAPERIVKTLDLYHSWIERYELINDVDNGLGWAISNLVAQLPAGGRPVLETLVDFFGNVIVSDFFYDVGAEWVKAAQNSNGVGVCFAYCEIVEAGFRYKKIWEESIEEVRRKEWTVRLYSMLCDQDIWLQKRQVLSRFFLDHQVLAQKFSKYLTVPSASSDFEDVKRYVTLARQEKPPLVHYDEKQHQKSIKDINFALRFVEKIEKNLDK